MDATYHSEFRELFAVHLAAFDAKLEQRLGEMKAELRKEIGDFTIGFRPELARMETRLIRWLFFFWVTNVGVMIALLKL